MKIKTTPPPIRALSAFFALAVVFAQIAALIPFSTANAAQIIERKLTLKTSDAGVGGSTPGGVVDHEFDFKIPSTTSLGSVRFQYCTQPADVGAATCTAPPSLDTSTSTLGSTNGAFGSLTMQHVSTNEFYLTRSPGGNFTPGGANTEFIATIKNVHNPQGPSDNYTFFVRIWTYDSVDSNLTTGNVIDSGSVAASTADTVVVSGTMPESLVFCTGATIGLDVATSTVPDCSTATTANIPFNQLFSPQATAIATSQMAASTNAGFGYAITVNGPTLTSGTNTIAAMGTPTGSAKGVSQFGLNLVANTVASAAGFTDDVADPSKDPAPLPNGTNLKGQPLTDYGTADQFKYIDGDAVANSEYGYTQGVNTAATDMQIFTVSYIANVPGSQPAGTYTSTLTYVCTPKY